MAKREILGKVKCPECGFAEAEIKPQKSGLLYRWCPDCSAQYFTRSEEASARLAKLCGAPLPELEPAAPAPATQKVAIDTPKVAPSPAPVAVQKKPTYLEILGVK